MDDKELVNSKQITQSLIGYWFLWGIVLGIAYNVIYSILSRFSSSLVIKAFLAIVLQGFLAFFVWKLSISSSFKKKTISFNDVASVMKNIIIFTIIICILTGIYNFVNITSNINKLIESNSKLKYTESMLSHIYTDTQMQEYNKQKEEAIKEVKSQCYTYLFIIEIGITVVHLAVLPLVKKEILKYTN